MVALWLSIFPGSFPVVGLRGPDKVVGEIGRDGDPYWLKISSPVRSCIVSGMRRNRGWKIEDGGDGPADIGICGTITGRGSTICLVKWSLARETREQIQNSSSRCLGKV